MDSQATTLSFDNCFRELDPENLEKLIQLWTSFPCPNLEGKRDTPGLKETYQETLAAQPEVDTAGAIRDECLEFLQQSQAQEERPCRNVLPPPEIQGPEKLPCEAAVPEPLPGPMPGAGEEVEEGASGPVKTKKRKWVRFSPYQRQVLMERFKVNRNLTTKDVKDLSSQLGLSPKQVRDWFQKQRKNFKLWFPHLLNGEQGADSKSVQKMNEGWSVKSGVGARLQFLLEK